MVILIILVAVPIIIYMAHYLSIFVIEVLTVLLTVVVITFIIVTLINIKSLHLFSIVVLLTT